MTAQKESPGLDETGAQDIAAWDAERHVDCTAAAAVDAADAAAELGLAAEHYTMLSQKSGISDDVIRARGYRTVTRAADLKRLGFGATQLIVPTLLVPVLDVFGKVATYQHRPDRARLNSRSGKPIKYETMLGKRMVLDVPVAARQQVKDPRVPLFLTEGAKKADAAVTYGLCCLALLGVWNWRGTNDAGGKTALADWEVVALNERKVYICFDSDVMEKEGVYQALLRLHGFLHARGAHARLVCLEPAADGGKVGLDDFAVAHRGENLAELLMQRSVDQPRQPPGEAHPDCPYEATPAGLVWHKRTAGGIEDVRLTNWTARLTADVLHDDGAEQTRRVEIIATLRNKTRTFSIAAPEFPSLNWAVAQLGAGAIIEPGQAMRERARVAIQKLSGEELPERVVYTHTGWRQVAGVWCYLHSGGAIGPDGPVADVEVALDGTLRLFQLPDPPAGEELREAIRASLRVLTLGPHAVTCPLLLAVYRAVLGRTDFTLFMEGKTGWGKSELSALCQQHYGSGFDARHLPGNFESTANATAELPFVAKDALLVVDDFAPGGSAVDVQRLHAAAARLFRSVGNGAGKQRMRQDTTLRPPHPPRGLVLASGEDIPRGASVRARLLIVEVSASLISPKLTACQADARNGLYAQALSGYLQWVAQHYETIHAQLPALIAEQRAQLQTTHARTADIVASLLAGWRVFLTFAREAEAVTEEEAQQLYADAQTALLQVAQRQAEHQASSDPVRRFLELLTGALASGKAHIASETGQEPRDAAAWGWRGEDRSYPGSNGEEMTSTTYRPLGACIGWLENDALYLEPEASYRAAQDMAGPGGEGIAIGKTTLHKRLAERGLLRSTDKQRGRLLTRHVLAGARRDVLHLRAGALSLAEKPSHSSHSSHLAEEEHESISHAEQNGTIPWDGFQETEPKTSHKNAPLAGQTELTAALSGTNGTNGTFSGGESPSSTRGVCEVTAAALYEEDVA